MIFEGIIGIFLLIVGILSIVKPEVMWLISDSWKSQNSNGSSDFYKMLTRLGGLVMVVGSIMIALNLMSII